LRRVEETRRSGVPFATNAEYFILTYFAGFDKRVGGLAEGFSFRKRRYFPNFSRFFFAENLRRGLVCFRKTTKKRLGLTSAQAG